MGRTKQVPASARTTARDPFVEKIAATIRRHDLLPRGKTVGVAVSGGPDSVALLAALAELAPRWGCRLAVLHVNHALRGRESGADQRFVRRLAARYGLRFRVGNLGRLRAYRKILKMGGATEEFLRTTRYAMFDLLAGETGASVVALGHHRDDLAETVLMHLLRGSGPAGLGGFRATSQLGHVTFVRPLYDCTRAEILEFCKRRGLSWREDRTNRDPRWLRNRIRHEILPMLEKEFNPRLRELLADNARWFRQDEDYFEARAREALGPWPRGKRAPESVALKALRALDLPVLARLFRIWVMAATGQSSPPPARQIEDLVELVRRGDSRRHVRCRAGVTFYVERSKVICWRPPIPGQPFFRPEKGEETAAAKDQPPLLRLAGERELLREGKCKIPAAPTRQSAEPSRVIELKLRRWNRRRQPKLFEQTWMHAFCGTKAADLTQYFDADQIEGALILRNRRSGDRFHPLGAPGSRKLKEFLIDFKAPARLRDRLLLLCDGRKVLWVVGLRTAHAPRLTDKTKNILSVRINFAKPTPRKK